MAQLASLRAPRHRAARGVAATASLRTWAAFGRCCLAPVDVLPAHPVITTSVASTATGRTRPAVANAIEQLAVLWSADSVERFAAEPGVGGRRPA